MRICALFIIYGTNARKTYINTNVSRKKKHRVLTITKALGYYRNNAYISI